MASMNGGNKVKNCAIHDSYTYTDATPMNEIQLASTECDCAPAPPKKPSPMEIMRENIKSMSRSDLRKHKKKRKKLF